LPISFDSGHYRQGGPNDFIIFRENPNIKGPINVEQYLELIKNQHQGLLVPAAFSQYNSLPSRTMFLNVDTARVKALGIIPEGKEHLLTDRMVWGLKSGKNGMEKNTLMLLDMIVTNNWERPIYFNNTSLMGISVDLGRYVVQEGNAYRLLPLENPDINELGEMVNTEIMYDNLMNNFHYRELDNPRVDYNEDYRQFVLNHRASFNSLAEALLREGKTEKASEIILKNLRTMPDEAIPYDFTTAKTVDLLYAIDEHERALEISQIIGERSNELLAYYTRKRAFDRNDFARNLAILRDISITLNTNGEMELAQRYNQALQEHYNVFQYMDLRR
jgi:tetratricopeptide (TPR) repeat protein